MNQTRIGSGSEYVVTSRMHDSETSWVIGDNNTTVGNTTLFYTNNSATVDYNNMLDQTYIGAGGYEVGMVRGKGKRPGAFRAPKKKRGDTTGANSQDKRISMGPIAIFRIMKSRFTTLELGKLKKRMEQMSRLLVKAERGQVALTEELEDKLLRIMREAEMAACGFTKFVSKKTLNHFEKISARKITITKLKNYARLIPQKVRDRMAFADEKGLFDGYVIVHTDPDNKAVKKTKEEKRDPICFGVIGESDDFYFVDDWKDELCDLTMDEIIKTLDLEKSDFTFESNFGKRLEAALA